MEEQGRYRFLYSLIIHGHNIRISCCVSIERNVDSILHSLRKVHEMRKQGAELDYCACSR